MSKTLTEQWENRSLKSGTYYIKVKFGDNLIYTFDYYNDRNNEWSFFRDIRDVLDIVPSYEEWKQAKENLIKNGTWYTERSYKLLEKKLEIATKALKEYANCKPTVWMSCVTADIALKEMEGVK